MFTGIIETVELLKEATPVEGGLIQILIIKPVTYDDLRVGDSIAVNGVCLTLEDFSESFMKFTLGPETIAITGWTAVALIGAKVNLERSLRFGDRVHGHLVSGHVDCMGELIDRRPEGEALWLRIGFPADSRKYLWPKGSVTINGVSLTVNKVNECIEVCLIPETIRRTNLGNSEIGQKVTLEFDWMAKAVVSAKMHELSKELA